MMSGHMGRKGPLGPPRQPLVNAARMRALNGSPENPLPLGTIGNPDNAHAAALALPCERHDAPAGRHCWTLPEALCGERVARALGRVVTAR